MAKVRVITRSTHKLKLLNLTSILFQGEIASTIEVEQPPKACKLLIDVSGEDCTGSVTVMGSLDGPSDSEIVGFTEARSKPTLKFWDHIDEVRISRLAGWILIKAVDAALQEIKWLESLGPYGCVFSDIGGLKAAAISKSTGIEAPVFYYCRTKAPLQVNSEFTVSPGYDGMIFQVKTGVSSPNLPNSNVSTGHECYAIQKL